MGQLTEDRGFIEAALLQNMSVSKIALHLNRHRSTIYREIKRNTMKQEGIVGLDQCLIKLLVPVI
ncbi:helix-turn-helix domain-containing protein [Enterococcus termitis]